MLSHSSKTVLELLNCFFYLWKLLGFNFASQAWFPQYSWWKRICHFIWDHLEPILDVEEFPEIKKNLKLTPNDQTFLYHLILVYWTWTTSSRFYLETLLPLSLFCSLPPKSLSTSFCTSISEDRLYSYNWQVRPFWIDHCPTQISFSVGWRMSCCREEISCDIWILCASCNTFHTSPWLVRIPTWWANETYYFRLIIRDSYPNTIWKTLQIRYDAMAWYFFVVLFIDLCSQLKSSPPSKR